MTLCPLSQGHPCPQLFAKRYQTSIGKDIHNDLFGRRNRKEREREKRKERERGRKREKVKIHAFFCEEDIDRFINEL
jgi:hypothetical protein